MARGDNDSDNLMNRLRQMSEEGITGFFNEIMSNDRMRSSFGKAGERFMANKQSFDRNVEQVLDFVNIPSKRDVRDLKARLSNLMGVHKALRIIFREPQRGYAWIRAANSAFGGKSALDVMLGGELTDLMRVRRYLDNERGGW